MSPGNHKLRKLLSTSAILLTVTAAHAQTGASGPQSPAKSPPPAGSPPTESASHAEPATAEGSEEPELDVLSELERARSLYQAGSYDRCTEAYAQVFKHSGLDAKIGPEALEQARLYNASCLLAQGRTEEADAQLRAALTANPLMASPDPVLFPTKVRDLFFKVKGSFLEEIRIAQEEKLEKARELAAEKERQAKAERARIANLEQLAAQETLVHSNERWIAAVPFGVGQFQNGDIGLGTLFLGTEVLLLGTAVVAASRELSLHSQANDGPRDIDQLNANVELARNVANWATGSLLLVTAVGIAEAQINFVAEEPLGVRRRGAPAGTLPDGAGPERRRPTEPRRSPRGPRSQQQTQDLIGVSLQPVFSAGPKAGYLGISGTF